MIPFRMIGTNLNILMNLDSFSHGQISSKIWLCEKLEPLIKEQSSVAILGCWINVLGFMLLTRRPNHYGHIHGIDIDMSAVDTANKICSYWYIECIQRSECADANIFNSQGYDVVINCSGEHMNSNVWFDNIAPNTLVCIQSSNVTDPNEPWLVKNPSPTYESFLEKYPLSVGIYSGILPIRYSDSGYDRYMTIGIK